MKGAGGAWNVELDDESCVFASGTRIGRVSRFLSPAVDFLNSDRSWAISEIPDCVDDEGKLTLVRRLQREVHRTKPGGCRRPGTNTLRVWS